MDNTTSRSNSDKRALLFNSKNEINHSDNERRKSMRSSIAKQSFIHTELSGKVGVFGVLLTIVGTIIGGGIVGIPYATLKTGIWMMLVLHFLNFIWGIYSIHLLLEAKNISGLASFSELGYYAFGRSSIFMINGLVAIAQCGMPIVYFMIIGSIGNGLLTKIDSINGEFWSSTQFSILVVAVLLFYFAIKKEIQELKSAGFILLCGVVFFVIALTILLIIEGTGPFDFADISKPKFDLDMLANIPTIFLAYGFQSAFFPAFQSLKDKTDANGMKSTVGSFIFCITVYIAASVVSLLKFGTNLKGNVLENVSDLSGALPIIVDIIFLLIAMMHVPIVLFVGKESVLIIIDEIMRKSYSNAPRAAIDDAYNLRDEAHKIKQHTQDDEGKAYLTMNPILFYGVSISIYVLIVTLACVLKDITLVFGVIGSLAGSYLIFIAPSSFYIMAVRIEGEEISIVKKIIVWVYMLFGFLVMFSCLFATIYTAAVN